MLWLDMGWSPDDQMDRLDRRIFFQTVNDRLSYMMSSPIRYSFETDHDGEPPENRPRTNL